MNRGQAIRAALSLIWRECGVVLPPEEQPCFFLTVHALLNEAVSSEVRQELQKRSVLESMYEVSPN